MVMFSKKTTKTLRPARVRRMENRELPAWFDTLVMHLGQSFDDWRYHGAPIEEVESHLETLVAIIEEIKDRGVVQ